MLPGLLMSNPAPITLEQLFRYYRAGLPHQMAAITELERDILQSGYTVAMRRDRPWFNTWSQSGKQEDPKPLVPPLKLDPGVKSVQLPVAYEAQNDNKSGTGYRECFSSSCAMLARYWGRIANDDAYNKVRAKYGDTTDAQAQLRALRSLGLKAEFRTNGTPAILERELSEGRPVAVGWLHHGHVTAPTGGGHWTVCIGFNDTSWIINDPNGQADLINGGYTPDMNGSCEIYSRKNFDPRWMVGGTGGWYLTASL